MKCSIYTRRMCSIAFVSIITLIFVFSFLPYSFYALAAEPRVEWNLTFGGRYGDGAWCLQETQDGGNILVGNSASRGEGSDLFLIRTDALGNCIWSRIFGGSGEDVGYFVQETGDGGFIVTGSTKSFSFGEELLWLVKTDGNGSLSWDRTFGGFVSSSGDGGWSVDETDDAGFITTGYTRSKGNGRKDLWLIKTDGQGSRIWDKTFGGQEDDVGMSVFQSLDGGYIVAGRTASFGKGGDDIWLLKTDPKGEELWNITFGGKQDDVGFQVAELADGYAVVGRTQSGSDKKRIILIKVDLAGKKLWERTYWGSSAASLQLAADGGFVMTGRIDNQNTGRDALIIKTDSTGREEWSMAVGGGADDIGTFVVQSRDGSYKIAGITSSQGSGSEDAWLVKIQGETSSGKNESQLLNSTLPNFAQSSSPSLNSSSLNSSSLNSSSLNSSSLNSSSLNSPSLNSTSSQPVQADPTGNDRNEAPKTNQFQIQKNPADGGYNDFRKFGHNFEDMKKSLKDGVH